ncbi:hypothetical protein V5O48_003697 [Marasmius crinis-equi]|uniref:RanBD1 domain-containing protein n=1 Tax=Marasmius crinis-equi TaxID=585013 RepID=A0ABR3FS49_9AGAR
MKRVAEKQITKDGGHDDDDEIEETEGFKKADDSVLKERKIAGLPKRGLKKASSGQPEDAANKSGGSTFGGFAGFGGNAPSAFTFNPPPVAPAPTTSSTSPSVAPTATSAAKALSSFLGVPATNGTSNTTQKTSPLTSQPTIPNIESGSSPSPAEGGPAVDYYTSLRGLNVSLVSTVTKAVEGDQFVDVSGLLDRYKSLRSDIQKDYDQKLSKTLSPSPTLILPGSAMPTPPSSFVGFSTSTVTSSTASSSGGGGFVPTAGLSSSSTKSAFSFPSAAPPSSSTTKPAGLSFAVTSSSSTAPSAPAPLNLFKSSTATTTANLFGNSTSTTPTPSLFGAPATGSIFGAPSNDKSASPSAPTTPPPSGKSAFSGFGAKTSPGSGSIGNPVGFGFGAPSGSASSFSFAAPSGSSPFGGGGSFSFAKPPPQSQSQTLATPPASQETADGGASGSQTETESQGAQSQSSEDGVATGIFGSSPHDGEGEGEENEDTIHSVKSKVYKMKKEGGTTSWAELGTGFLKLKKQKAGEQRRLLLRNSSNGKININFSLYHGLKPSHTSKTVSFIGHEDGKPQTYSVRVKTEEQARELKDILDREIAFVKAKSTD